MGQVAWYPRQAQFWRLLLDEGEYGLADSDCADSSHAIAKQAAVAAAAAAEQTRARDLFCLLLKLPQRGPNDLQLPERVLSASLSRLYRRRPGQFPNVDSAASEYRGWENARGYIRTSNNWESSQVVDRDGNMYDNETLRPKPGERVFGNGK
jgi:hypothetical protein